MIKYRHHTKRGPGRMPYNKTSRPTGAKLQKQINRGVLGMDNSGGSVSAALREIAHDRRKKQ